MKKIKRVALVHSSGVFYILHGDFPHSARTIDILNTLYEIGKNEWIGRDLYKVFVDGNGCKAYLRYEVYSVRV